MRTMIFAATIALVYGPALAQDAPPSAPSLEAVEAIFRSVFETNCPLFGDEPLEPPQAFEATFRYDSDDVSEPPRPLRVYQFFCYAGAYNASFVFFTWEELEGLRPVSLTVPRLAVTYADEQETEVETLSITGYAARPFITNATFDPETLTITSESYWRGLGDASSGGVWGFDEGDFVMRSYFVDATYDGEVTPETIIDFSTPMKVK